MRYLAAALLACLPIAAADKYDGPKPPKADIPYLVHANKLIELEQAEAREEAGRKDESTFVIEGAASPVKTPLAEPRFLLKVDQITPENLELYRLDVRNGRREVTIGKRRKSNVKQVRILVTPLGEGYFRVEATETLENGQYSLTPNGSNKVFCFEVY